MFERTIAEGFKNDFASVWGHNERFRWTIPPPCFGVPAPGPDVRYGRGAREAVCANEFVGHVCHQTLVKPEVPWLLHNLVWGTSGLDERELYCRERVRFEQGKQPFRALITMSCTAGPAGQSRAYLWGWAHTPLLLPFQGPDPQRLL